MLELFARLVEGFSFYYKVESNISSANGTFIILITVESKIMQHKSWPRASSSSSVTNCLLHGPFPNGAGLIAHSRACGELIFTKCEVVHVYLYYYGCHSLGWWHCSRQMSIFTLIMAVSYDHALLAINSDLTCQWVNLWHVSDWLKADVCEREMKIYFPTQVSYLSMDWCLYW